MDYNDAVFVQYCKNKIYNKTLVIAIVGFIHLKINLVMVTSNT